MGPEEWGLEGGVGRAEYLQVGGRGEQGRALGTPADVRKSYLEGRGGVAGRASSRRRGTRGEATPDMGAAEGPGEEQGTRRPSGRSLYDSLCHLSGLALWGGGWLPAEDSQ